MSKEKYREIMQGISYEWKNMEASQKRWYKEMYEETKKEYEDSKSHVKLFNTFEKMKKIPNKYLLFYKQRAKEIREAM